MGKRTKTLTRVQVECRCCGAVFETQGKNTKYCADEDELRDKCESCPICEPVETLEEK